MLYAPPTSGVRSVMTPVPVFTDATCAISAMGASVHPVSYTVEEETCTQSPAAKNRLFAVDTVRVVAPTTAFAVRLYQVPIVPAA